MDASLIKQIREETGAGIVDIKSALEEAGGDPDKAKEILKKRGAQIAAKKQEREAKEGLVYAYIHPPGKLGAMVVLNCETDFVAKNEEFKELAHQIAMQIAAMNPQYVNIEDIPEEVLEKEKSFYREQFEKEGKPQDVIEKIVEGKMQKFYEEVCLMEQVWIQDDSKKIKDLIVEKTAKLGEKITIGKFVRFTV